MLPEYRHEADEDWIKERFDEIVRLSNWGYAKRIMEKYSEAYKLAHDNEEKSFRKGGVARYEANTRLRKIIDSMKAKITAPPSV